MMKEIKYRFWDENSKHMVSWEEAIAEWESEGYNASMFGQDHYHALQYIGLKDKNGREIYEGDIVKNHNWIRPIKGEPKDISQIWEVCLGEHETSSDYYASTAYGWFFRCKHEEASVRQVWGELEVIGNIYENPELLEG